MLNKNLNMKQHTTKIANTISKTIGIISKLKYELSESTLLNIYNSLILPQAFRIISKKIIYHYPVVIILIMNLSYCVFCGEIYKYSSSLVKYGDYLPTTDVSLTTLPYPTLPYPTLPYPTLPYPTLPYPTLPYPTLPYPTLPYPTLPYPTLPYPTLPYPTLPYPTLPYPTLPYPTLPYPTLPYPNLP